jgi:predicted dehydrogenase
MEVAPEQEQMPAVAVLGQGSIGRRHARNLRALGCEVIAFDPVATEAVNGVRRVMSAREALEAVDAVVVASPTSEHLAHVREAVASDRHVLVEKPLAVTLDGVDEVLGLAAERGVLVAVAMNLRFHPGPRGLKELLGSGAIGRPLSAHFTFGYHLPSWRPGTDYTQSYSARSDLGGGVLLDVIHEIDYASWLLGPVTEVSGWTDRISALELDVEDVGLVAARFANGAVGSFTLDYLDRSYRRGCWIVGEEGTARWSWRDEVVELLGPDGTQERRSAPSAVDQTYRDEAAEFIAAVRAGRISTDGTRLASSDEGRAALAVVDAVRSSAAAGGASVRVASPA